jgi:hypothetical protein
MTALDAAMLGVCVLCLVAAMYVGVIRSNRSQYRERADRRAQRVKSYAEHDASPDFGAHLVESTIVDVEKGLR